HVEEQLPRADVAPLPDARDALDLRRREFGERLGGAVHGCGGHAPVPTPASAPARARWTRQVKWMLEACSMEGRNATHWACAAARERLASARDGGEGQDALEVVVGEAELQADE